jgi:hypothetical protein
MTDKLETLKDMPDCQGDDNLDDNYKMVFKSTLRQEAIKWIKSEPNFFMLNIIADGSYYYNVTGIDYYRTKRVIEFFIKHFFNITEEELK